MSEILSKEEIDALLNGNSNANDTKMELIVEEKEALAELCNIGMDAVSRLLLSKLQTKISITVNDISYFGVNDIAEFTEPLSAFSVEYKDCIEDTTYFLLKTHDINILNDLLIGGDGAEPNDLDGNHADIILEVFRDVMPDVTTSISEIIKVKLSAAAPELFTLGKDNSNLKELINNKKMVRVTFDLEIGTVIKSQIYQLMPVSMSRGLVSLLLHTMEIATPSMGQEPDNAEIKSKSNNKSKKGSSVTVKPVIFPQFDEDDESYSYDENIDFILDVPLNISVVLGSTTKSIKDILNFNIGSVIELNSLAEDYVDILVNGKLIARGEVIVIEENFGVRIKELFTSNQKELLSNK